MANKDMVTMLQRDGVLKTPEIIAAFNTIDRADFVPTELRDEAYANMPLPIGYEQTISQPWTVAFMLELLQPKPGDHVFDIGSGSGWQTALLASIVGAHGHVTALELISELCTQSIQAIDRYDFIKNKKAEVRCLDATNGFAKNAPYDRIIVAAMAGYVPDALLEQLRIGGVLVLPMNGSVWQICKASEQELQKKEFPGFAFVPFKTAHV